MATHDKKLYKKCIKCRKWLPRVDLREEAGGEFIKRAFGVHNDAEDGLQTICMKCKHTMNTASRNRNVTARIRHHTATRCLTQLGKQAPQGFAANLETHLGYRIRVLVRHLGADLKSREGPRRKLVDALNEGYHVDHVHPLSRFPVLTKGPSGGEEVNWDVFRECWAISNLRAIPAEENLKKGAKI